MTNYENIFLGFLVVLTLCLPLVDSLCINSELKNKLQDVLIPENLLTLGHMLGKGNTESGLFFITFIIRADKI